MLPGKALSMDAARAMLGMFYNYDEEEIDVLLSGIVMKTLRLIIKNINEE